MTLEDLIAIALAVAAAGWLVRRWSRSVADPPCGPRSGTTAGADGFVAVERIAPPATSPGDRRPG